ncbi:hypothetical protein LCGC14_1682180 [marine sediment metagenome]|uniref:HNH nuclease domain-containing protein n=1 Tax=marine sediment metagenome TaxID=412755 RepID=A0A0F9K3T1_9ZZZZ
MSKDMRLWIDEYDYEKMCKKFNKKSFTLKEIEEYKESLNIYGICPNCNEFLEKEDLCNFCGWVNMTEEKRKRTILKSVQREVWRRDLGECVECGSKERLEFDHIIPFSKGGSNTARNIQLLCEKCNRSKGGDLG